MTTTKKIVTVGSSRGLTLSKTWLDYQAKKHGGQIKEVILTETANGFLIVPVPPQAKPKPE